MIVGLAEKTQKQANSEDWQALRPRWLISNSEGWKALRPGWLINGTLVASFGMCGFFGYLRFFVGSTRADADTQMTYLLILVLFFGFSSVYLIVFCHFRTVKWNNDTIQIGQFFNSPKMVPFEDVVTITKNEFLGLYRLILKDGNSIRISIGMYGTHQLLAELTNDNW